MRYCVFSARHPSVLVLAALCFSAVSGFAERKKGEPTDIPPPPPLAVSLEVEVFKGESVSIPLIARGRSASDASFRLRSRTRNGTLGEINPVRPGQAVIEYRHGDGPAPARDEFTFAVQSPGSPVSAPAKILINIRLRPAELLAPRAVEFGEVLVGKEVTGYVTLSNVGGEALETKITAGEEWGFPEGREFTIAGGEARRVPVVFKPSEHRDYAGVLRFSHDEKLLVPISGTGVEPLRWSPPSLAIRQQEEEVDDVSLELENRTHAVLDGKISGADGISVAGEFSIPAGGTLKLPVRAVAGFPAGSAGELRIAHEHGEAAIPFRLYPAPAAVRFAPDDVVDFGNVVARQSVEQSLEFENSGGLPVAVSITPPQGVEAGGPMDFQLPPGNKTTLPLVFEGRRQGSWTGVLKIRIGGEEHSVPMRAFVAAAEEGAQLPSFVLPSGNAATPTATPGPGDAGPAPVPRSDAAPELTWENLRVVSTSPTAIVLEWDTEISSDRRIEIQQRSIGVDESGAVEIRWEPSAQADVYRSGDGAVRATIFGLEPGMRLHLRHVAMDEGAGPRGVSEMIVVQTPEPAPGFRFPWGWFIALLLVGFVIWHARKRHQAERREMDAEIRRLEDSR